MRSVGIAYLLWFFGGFGVLGLHRFYTNRVGTGILWFFTGGLFGIGALIDLFLIPGMVANANRGI
jgi:TM2 domain-containing membrane protein YozV